MKSTQIAIAAALLGAAAASAALAQQAASPQPQTIRLRGTIERLDGHAVLAKSSKGEELTLKLVDKVLVAAVVKASMADIKPGLFIGSGAMPQPDGSQKAIEVHIFAESMRGTGDGHRPWDGAPNSTMTNGTVGTTVTGVTGPVVTVKYKDGEKNIVVGPDVPIVRYEVMDTGALKPGIAFSVLAAAKQPDGSYNISRINIGRDGVVP